jgi:hypothetical protein
MTRHFLVLKITGKVTQIKCNQKLLNPLTHRAIKVPFIFLKRPEKTKIFKKEVEGSNRS